MRDMDRLPGFPVDWSPMPRLTRRQWSELLDELYGHATWLWEHQHEELADAVAELADALARQVRIASGMDMHDDGA